MKVLLIDIDSSIPNLALKKIKKYHAGKGDEVAEEKGDFSNSLFYEPKNYEKVYVSCVFTKNKDEALAWNKLHKNVVIGGSGVDLKVSLPPEIERLKPRINLGFTTRGCVRRCKFCIVPEKEGKMKVVADVYDLWDGKAKEIIILDNNILASPDHFELVVDQLNKEKLRVDFNQGLDCRLLNDRLAAKLATVKHINEVRFAFDDRAYEKSVIRAVNLMKKYKPGKRQSRFYVLVGFNSDFEDALYRVKVLKELDQLVYVMRFEGAENDNRYTKLCGWTNCYSNFDRMTWEEYLRSRVGVDIDDRQKEMFK